MLIKLLINKNSEILIIENHLCVKLATDKYLTKNIFRGLRVVLASRVLKVNRLDTGKTFRKQELDNFSITGKGFRTKSLF